MLNDVCANVLTTLATSPPQTENDKLVCTDLIDLGCAVMMVNEMSIIIRILCEIDWLLPCKSSINPTTVIYLK